MREIYAHKKQTKQLFQGNDDFLSLPFSKRGEKTKKYCFASSQEQEVLNALKSHKNA